MSRRCSFLISKLWLNYIKKKIKFKPNIFFTEIQAGGGSFVLEIHPGAGILCFRKSR